MREPLATGGLISDDAIRVIEVVKACLNDGGWRPDLAVGWRDVSIRTVTCDINEEYVVGFATNAHMGMIRATCDFGHPFPAYAGWAYCAIELFDGRGDSVTQAFECSIDGSGAMHVVTTPLREKPETPVAP